MSSHKDKWGKTGNEITTLLALLFSERQINSTYDSQVEFLLGWRGVIANLLALLFIPGQLNCKEGSEARFERYITCGSHKCD